MIKRSLFVGLLALGVAGFSSGCKKAEAPAASAPVSSKSYHGHGVITLFQAEGKVVVIKHEKIEGLMDAMTMGFELKDPSQSKALKVGDTVDFTLEVFGDSPMITQVTKAGK